MQSKRTILVLVACFGFLILYQNTVVPWWTKSHPRPAPAATPSEPVATPASTEGAAPATSAQGPDSSASRRTDSRPRVGPEEERLEVLENRRLRLTFSTVGATLKKAELLEYRREAKSQDPLDLLRHF